MSGTTSRDGDAALAGVTTGDSVAAIVYAADARSLGDRGSGVTIPASRNATTRHPIAVVGPTKNRPRAMFGIASVPGPTGQNVLCAAGFLPAH